MRPYQIEVIAPPAGPLVTVQEFIDHARLNALTVDRQPALIDREIAAATERGQAYTRRSFLTQKLRVIFLAVRGECGDPSGNILILPRPPIISVDKITSGDADLDATQYQLVGAVLTCFVTLGASTVVEYTAGYGDTAAAVPAAIREGVLEYATTVYERRTGDRDNKYQASATRTVPPGVVDLWRPFQVELSG